MFDVQIGTPSSSVAIMYLAYFSHPDPIKVTSQLNLVGTGHSLVKLTTFAATEQEHNHAELMRLSSTH